MSLEQIKAEVASMSVDQQNHLAAYLAHLRHQRDPALLRELTTRIDDRDPANWLTLNDLKEK